MKKSHMLIMLLCCLVPIAGLAAVYLFKLPLNSVVYGALALACPIGMGFMVFSMLKDHNSHDPQSAAHSGHSESIEAAARENNPS